MEKKISLFLAILTLGFAQQIFAQDENASANESERWSDFLPLNKELAGDADLPLPFGIGVTGYWQEQDMKTKSIGLPDINLLDVKLGIGALAIPGGAWDNILGAILAPSPAPPSTLMFTAGDISGPGGILDGLGTALGGFPDSFGTTATAGKVESEVNNYNVRLDAWVLPFLNVYGVAGKVNGENKVSGIEVDLSGIDPNYKPFVGQLVPSSFTLDYEGSVYGIGTVLAAGKGRYWGTIDYNFTRANLDISTSEIDTHTVTPRVGVKGEAGGIKGSLWIGSMFQRTDERQLGSLGFPSTNQTLDFSSLVVDPGTGTPMLPPETLEADVNAGDISASYDVVLEQEKEWNFLIGGSAQFSEQIHVSVEGGFGNRQQVMGNLTFRF
jgi:hypothetical protein